MLFDLLNTSKDDEDTRELPECNVFNIEQMKPAKPKPFTDQSIPIKHPKMLGSFPPFPFTQNHHRLIEPRPGFSHISDKTTSVLIEALTILEFHPHYRDARACDSIAAASSLLIFFLRVVNFERYSPTERNQSKWRQLHANSKLRFSIKSAVFPDFPDRDSRLQRFQTVRFRKLLRIG